MTSCWAPPSWPVCLSSLVLLKPHAAASPGLIWSLHIDPDVSLLSLEDLPSHPFHRWPFWPPRGGPSGVHYAASQIITFLLQLLKLFISSCSVLLSPCCRLSFAWCFWTPDKRPCDFHNTDFTLAMMLHEIWVLVSVCCSLHSMIYNLYPFLWCLKVFIKIGEVFSAAVRLSEELWSVNFPCIQWEPRTHEISLFFSCRNCMNQHNKTFEISTVHKNKLCTRWG